MSSELRYRGAGDPAGEPAADTTALPRCDSDEGVLVQKPSEDGSRGGDGEVAVDAAADAKEEPVKSEEVAKPDATQPPVADPATDVCDTVSNPPSAAAAGAGDTAVDEQDDPLSLTTGGIQQAVARAVVNKYPWVEDVFTAMVPVMEKGSEFLNFVGPYVVLLFEILQKVYFQLPFEVLTALFGLVLCFFGGAFVTLIAAGEAFKLCGGEKVFMNFRVIYRDYQRVRLAARRHNRVTRGEKLKPTDAILMAMKSVRDPERLSSSLSGIYTALLAVISTLRLQFARTITLGAAIGGMVKKPAMQYLAPSLENVLSMEMRKWVPQFISWGGRVIGLMVAFYTQRVISAVESAMRGGLLFVQHSLAYCRAHGYVKKTEHDATIDTVAGYIMAALGFYTQVYFGFQVPFPLSILCWPLSLLENFLLFFV